MWPGTPLDSGAKWVLRIVSLKGPFPSIHPVNRVRGKICSYLVASGASTPYPRPDTAVGGPTLKVEVNGGSVTPTRVRPQQTLVVVDGLGVPSLSGQGPPSGPNGSSPPPFPV